MPVVQLINDRCSFSVESKIYDSFAVQLSRDLLFRKRRDGEDAEGSGEGEIENRKQGWKGKKSKKSKTESNLQHPQILYNKV